MKSYNCLYENIDAFKIWLQNLTINAEKQCLVLIHTSNLKPEECVELAANIKKILSHARVVGAIVAGVIYEGEIYESGTLISVRELEFGKFYTKIQSTHQLSPQAIANSIAEQAKILPSRFANLFFNFSQDNVFAVTNHLNSLLPETAFVGGCVGKFTSSTTVESFVFDEEAVYYDSYLLILVSSDYVLAYSDIIAGHPPISEPMIVTKSHGRAVDEIDNVPALEWFSKNLGLESFSENTDWRDGITTDILLRFPIVLDGYTSTTRFLRYNEQEKHLELYNDELAVGQKVRVGYLSFLKSAEELQEVCHTLQMVSAEAIYCYSCVFRKDFSNSISKWELSAFKNSGISGAFMLGEIGTKDSQIQYLNGSSCFFTLAENAKHLEPDLSVFNSIEGLIETNDKLLSSIVAVNNTLQSEVFSSLIAHENSIKKRFTASNDEIGSITEFLLRQAKNKQEQICLISVASFEDHLLALGEKDFIELAEENRMKIIDFLKNQYSFYHFNFYNYDFAHFFFTIEENLNDTVFENLVRALSFACKNGEFIDEEFPCINDFTYTLNGLTIQQLLALSKIQDMPSEQRKYSQMKKDNTELYSLHDEFQMVAALKSILDKNAIVPYFQGIYDNKRHCFSMYEALMRLQHPGGKMLFPNDFMDIAKKYNLYLALSLAMVKKVFDLFRDRDEVITLNISAYDILSEEFRTTVFNYLENLPNPNNFIFELLETEAFTDLETLRIFIHQVKQYGCRIAVDDFGAGYSNFIEFGNLEVDFLKLNGSLTKLLGTDFNYNHILNSIAFMGEKMHVKLIAEFVETAATQKLLIQSGVHYSQGYFFSKPMPFSELEVVSAENKEKVQDVIDDADEEEIFNSNSTSRSNLLLIVGAFLIAVLSVLSVVFYVDFNKQEFKKINDSFLLELASGLSDKIALFAEESKISLKIINVAVSSHLANGLELSELQEELLELSKATKFECLYISVDGEVVLASHGNTEVLPNSQIYDQAKGDEIVMLPIAISQEGRKLLVFSSNLYNEGNKVGEIYGVYKVDEISKLLALKSFGGEAFYHISQVDGTPIHLSGRNENAFTSGDMYDFIGSLDIFNGHTAESIKRDMQVGKSVLLNYRLGEEERSAVMVRIPNTNWCVVSIVLAEINTQMLKSNSRSTFLLISFITALYAIYFTLTTIVFRKHRQIILKTLEASQSLSSSLQLSIEKDSLTGTFSRATAIEKISNVISSQKQKGVEHALAILDIDHFKYINDTYGHHTGDIYLQAFVSAVKLAIKPGNILGRLGGDEFLLLFNDTNKEEVAISFDNIFANIRKINLGGVDLAKVSVSAGIVMITENEATYEELMVEADTTLYKAKREGKNKYLFSENE